MYRRRESWHNNQTIIMNEKLAKEILGDIIQEDDSLKSEYINWKPEQLWPVFIRGVGNFTIKELKAISWWVNNKTTNKATKATFRKYGSIAKPLAE